MDNSVITPSKNASVVSVALTLLFLFIVALISVFGQMVALNGVMDRRATVAMVILVIAELLIIVLAGFFAGWLTSRMTAKFRWSSFPAVALTVIGTTGLGILFSLFAVILSILLAGIR